MKYTWRITKYNPAYRNERGIYINDEWTAYSDIGKSFKGKILTEDEYLRYENLYIDSIIKLMRASNIYILSISELEVYDENIQLKNGIILSIDDITKVIKSILRERIWCKLTYVNEFYVHFGYDFNMYVGSNKPSDDVLHEIRRSELFVEEFISPYLTDVDDDLA